MSRVVCPRNISSRGEREGRRFATAMRIRIIRIVRNIRPNTLTLLHTRNRSTDKQGGMVVDSYRLFTTPYCLNLPSFPFPC